MKLNELRDTSYEIAKSKGWHDDDLKRSRADLMALVISELAEALEEYRVGKPPREIEFRKEGHPGVVWYRPNPERPVDHGVVLHTGIALIESGYKPEGMTIELADALIRLGDCAGLYDMDLGEEELRNLVSPARAVVQCKPGTALPGFGEHFLDICRAACAAACCSDPAVAVLSAAVRTCYMAHWLGITGEELERGVEIKHAYNRTRPHRHGGKLL